MLEAKPSSTKPPERTRVTDIGLKKTALSTSEPMNRGEWKESGCVERGDRTMMSVCLSASSRQNDVDHYTLRRLLLLRSHCRCLLRSVQATFIHHYVTGRPILSLLAPRVLYTYDAIFHDSLFTFLSPRAMDSLFSRYT